MYSLTLYIYPSPYGVDWRSPLHLTRSVIKNAASLRPRQIGHVAIELKSDVDGRTERFFTGMTSNNGATNRKLIFLKQMGLGVLFHQYPGFLESIEKLDPELEKRLEKGHFSFVRFNLSKESYERARLYLNQYQERNVGKYYGLPQRPRYGEGAGCSAFAASFVEVAGVMRDEFKNNWSSQVRVPEEFLANIPIWRLLIKSAKNQRWANENEPGKNIFFWDPDMMHAWVNQKIEALKTSPSADLTVSIEKNTRGILVDSSKIVPNDESIWL